MINTNEILKSAYGLSNEVLELDRQVMQEIEPYFKRIDEMASYNQLRVLAAFAKCKIREPHFVPTTGYGYDDLGRDAIEELYAEVFECEDALVRHSIVSGTQALSICMFGVLRPGDLFVSLTGKPYDTLREVIGGDGVGSLKDFGVKYDEVPLKNGKPDMEGIKEKSRNAKAVLIQRSKGYDWRDTLTLDEIAEIIAEAKKANPDVICIVDNCYGEFTREHEPTYVGADLMAGSLIKNPGGGIARGGGYVAGKAKYVELAAYKLTCIGQGKEVGPTFGFNREILQGFFMAPHVTAQSVKAACYCGAMFEKLGYEVCPKFDGERDDIIQSVKFSDEAALIAFCQGIQKGSPIDSYVTPQPSDMPGYDCQVIMAAGAFTQGATTELSADAPVKPPYIGYMQGSLVFDSGRAGVIVAADNILNLRKGNY